MSSRCLAPSMMIPVMVSTSRWWASGNLLLIYDLRIYLMYTYVFIYTVKGPAISPITMRCNHVYHLPLTYKSLKCAFLCVYINVFAF